MQNFKTGKKFTFVTIHEICTIKCEKDISSRMRRRGVRAHGGSATPGAVCPFAPGPCVSAPRLVPGDRAEANRVSLSVMHTHEAFLRGGGRLKV